MRIVALLFFLWPMLLMMRLLKCAAGVFFMFFAAIKAAVLLVSNIQGAIAVPANMSETQAAIDSFLRWLANSNPVIGYLFSAILFTLGFGILFWHPEKGWAFYFQPQTSPLKIQTQIEPPAKKPKGSSSLRVAPGERVFSNRTPIELLELYQSNTAIQAKLLLTPYIGLWISVSGPSGLISSNEHNCTVFLTVDGGLSSNVYCRFAKSYENAFLRLKKGEVLTVTGRIFEIDVYLYLEDCEFTNP